MNLQTCLDFIEISYEKYVLKHNFVLVQVKNIICNIFYERFYEVNKLYKMK